MLGKRNRLLHKGRLLFSEVKNKYDRMTSYIFSVWNRDITGCLIPQSRFQ